MLRQEDAHERVNWLNHRRHRPVTGARQLSAQSQCLACTRFGFFQFAFTPEHVSQIGQGPGYAGVGASIQPLLHVELFTSLDFGVFQFALVQEHLSQVTQRTGWFEAIFGPQSFPHRQPLAIVGLRVGPLGLPPQHSRQVEQGSGDVGMIVVQQFLLYGQSLAIHGFGLGQPVFPEREQVSELMRHSGHSGTLVAQQFLVHRQGFTLQAFGFGQAVLCHADLRQEVERAGHFGILVAQHFPVHRQAFEAALFGLMQVAVVEPAVFFGLRHVACKHFSQALLGQAQQADSEAGQRIGNTLIFLAQPRSSHLQAMPRQRDHLFGISQVIVGVSQGEAHVHFHLGQVGQVCLHPPGSVRDKFVQYCRIAAFGHRRADTEEDLL